MKTLIIITTFIYLIFFSFLGLNVQAQENEEVDTLTLAALLIKNKNYSRAQGVLSQIKDPHEVIPEKYWSLMGVLELRQKRFQEALNAFQKAEKEGLKSKDLYLGLAQAYLGLKQFDKGISILMEHTKVCESDALYFQLLTSLHFEKSQGEKAWSYLHAGLKKFPKFLPLMKQKWFYLVENNLIEVSYTVGKEMVDKYNLSALDIARMGQKYRQAKDLDKAIFFGEIARLKDSSDEEIIKDLARSYIKKENILAAAQLFTALSHHDPKFLVESSELWRKAGYPVYAERLAMDIRDPVKKIKQNLTLALINEDFNKMSLLGKEAIRTTLKEDQDIQYALAYANFMLGDYKSANNHLKVIQREDLFKKAIALREAMESCQEEALCL